MNPVLQSRTNAPGAAAIQPGACAVAPRRIQLQPLNAKA
jgi:hypothetical protein